MVIRGGDTSIGMSVPGQFVDPPISQLFPFLVARDPGHIDQV